MVRPERAGFTGVMQLSQPGHRDSGGQPRREASRSTSRSPRDCRGEDAFRGCEGGTRHATEAIVLADQPGAQRPYAPVQPGVAGRAVSQRGGALARRRSSSSQSWRRDSASVTTVPQEPGGYSAGPTPTWRSKPSGDAVRQCGAAVGYGTYYTKGNTLEGLPPSVRGLGGSGDQDGSRADLTHRGSPRDRRGPLPALVIVWWSRVHQLSSPSSSWNVPVGPSWPIVAIRTMFRALTSTGRPPEFCTPPSSVAV